MMEGKNQIFSSEKLDKDGTDVVSLQFVNDNQNLINDFINGKTKFNNLTEEENDVARRDRLLAGAGIQARRNGRTGQEESQDERNERQERQVEQWARQEGVYRRLTGKLAPARLASISSPPHLPTSCKGSWDCGWASEKYRHHISHNEWQRDGNNPCPQEYEDWPNPRLSSPCRPWVCPWHTPSQTRQGS